MYTDDILAVLDEYDVPDGLEPLDTTFAAVIEDQASDDCVTLASDDSADTWGGSRLEDDLSVGLFVPLPRFTKRQTCIGDPVAQETLLLTEKRGTVGHSEQTQRAKEICRACPALGECVKYAMLLPLDKGDLNDYVIAGMNTVERARAKLVPAPLIEWQEFPRLTGGLNAENKEAMRKHQVEIIVDAAANLLGTRDGGMITFENIMNVTGCSKSAFDQLRKEYGIDKSTLITLAHTRIQEIADQTKT